MVHVSWDKWALWFYAGCPWAVAKAGFSTNACCTTSGEIGHPCFKNIQRCGLCDKQKGFKNFSVGYYQELIGDCHQQVMRVSKAFIYTCSLPRMLHRSKLNHGPYLSIFQHNFPAEFGFLPGFCVQSWRFVMDLFNWRAPEGTIASGWYPGCCR